MSKQTVLCGGKVAKVSRKRTTKENIVCLCEFNLCSPSKASSVSSNKLQALGVEQPYNYLYMRVCKTLTHIPNYVDYYYVAAYSYYNYVYAVLCSEYVRLNEIHFLRKRIELKASGSPVQAMSNRIYAIIPMKELVY